MAQRIHLLNTTANTKTYLVWIALAFLTKIFSATQKQKIEDFTVFELIIRNFLQLENIPVSHNFKISILCHSSAVLFYFCR